MKRSKEKKKLRDSLCSCYSHIFHQTQRAGLHKEYLETLQGRTRFKNLFLIIQYTIMIAYETIKAYGNIRHGRKNLVKVIWGDIIIPFCGGPL
jgi:hypothetical protein